MALMNIRVGGVPIDLMANLTETSNACVTVYEFDIITTPNASITLEANRLNNGVTDYDTVQVNIPEQAGVRSYWKRVYNNMLPYTFTCPLGTAKVRLTLGNVPLNATGSILNTAGVACNITNINVIDNTNTDSETATFNRCNTAARCSEPEPEPTPITIENDTNVFIYFDSSGSMDSTLAPLQTMRDTLLKDALLPYYNNDETLYNSKVQVINEPNERTLHMLNILGTTPTSGKIISLVFQDEAEPVYTGSAGWTTNTERKFQYNTDLPALISRLDGYAADQYRGVVFQVNTGTHAIYDNFKALIKAVKYGTGQYAGVNGLSNRNEFNYKFDTVAGGTPEYYKDLVVTALQELGFVI